MPALVNYRVDDEFYTRGFNTDVYCPPRKRVRVSAPYVLDGYMFEQQAKASIETLPNECLFEIFRRMPGGRERSAAACVSRRWLTVLSSVRNSEILNDQNSDDVPMISADEDQNTECDGCLTRCLEGKKATDTRLCAIAVGTSTRGGLGKLLVRGSSSARGVTDHGITAIARGCPSLKVLSLWNTPAVGDEGLSEVAKECISLERLDLCQCPSISSKALVAIAENCPNLTSLTIESCSRIGNEGLQAVGRFCPKIQSVTIKDCPLVGDQGVASLLSSASGSLAKLKLHGLNITDFSLAVIGHYGKAMSSLVLGCLKKVSQKGFWVMGNARGLQALGSLTILSCTGATDMSLEALGNGCPNLKQMCLRRCCFISDNGLVAFAKTVTCLDSLQLEECNRITQWGILNAISNCGSRFKSLSVVKCMGVKDLPVEASMLPPCESLRSLSVRNCLGFGGSSLAMVGKLCPNLHHLDLSSLPEITDAAFLSLIDSLEAGLTKVNLGHCSNLTDESILALVRVHGESLELLNLEGCRNVTDASLAAVAEHCSSLDDLDLSKCSITDSGIAALSRGSRLNLRVLSLSGCSVVSNKSVPCLKKLGKTLLGLNLQHCNSISSSKVENLVENLWRCDILA